MRQLSNQTTKPASLWQRLLAVFNLGGPQWGKPGDSRGDKKDDEESSQNSDDEKDDKGDDDERDERPSRQPGRKPQSGESPPDLDEIWRDLSGRLGGLLGGGKGTNRPRHSGGGNGGGRSGPAISGKAIMVVIALAFLGWLASGLFTVQEGEQSVILTFGKHTRTVGPGLSWHFPQPIEDHETVATAQLQSVDIGNSVVNSITGLNNASMLTQDKNILDLRFTVQYRIDKLEAFLFNNANAKDAVVLAAESAVREVLGKTPMDVALNQGSCVAADSPYIDAGLGRSMIDRTEDQAVPNTAAATTRDGLPTNEALEELIGGDESQMSRTECPADLVWVPLYDPIKGSIQAQLDNLGLGLEIVAVNMSTTGVQVPDKVKPAFDDARSATAEKESLINQGRLYANQRIASARGVVARLGQDAEGYKSSVVATARGDTQRFLQIYEQYRHAPDVTRNRMYLETMQEIYGNVSKVMMESKNNSLLYLPIDQLMNQGNRASNAANRAATNNAPTTENSTNSIDRGNGTVTVPAVVQQAERPNMRSRDAFGRSR